MLPRVAEPFVLIPPRYTRTHCYKLTLCVYDVKVGLALAVRAELICRNVYADRKTHIELLVIILPLFMQFHK